MPLLRVVVVLFVLLATSGCTRDAAYGIERGAAEFVCNELVLDVGEEVSLYLYDHHTGFETQGFSCSDDEGETGMKVDAPDIVSVRREPRIHRVRVNLDDVGADVFTLRGEREGIATVTARCSGHEASFRVRVGPA